MEQTHENYRHTPIQSKSKGTHTKKPREDTPHPRANYSTAVHKTHTIKIMGRIHTKSQETRAHARAHYCTYVVRKTCPKNKTKKTPPSFPLRHPPGLQAGQRGFTGQGHFHRRPEVSQANAFPVNVPSATIRQKHILRLIGEHRTA